MVVIAGEARLVGFGRRDARSEVDRLYRKHSDEVLRYAMLVLRSRPDAEDVVQATFMRALRAIRRGERVQKPRNWLIKIAHNECRRALSVRSRRAEVELNDVASESAESGRADELRQALGQLAPKQREALVLRELEGRSYSEIAATLGISGSAVETLIFRARRAVREQLESALACDEAVELIAADAVAEEDRRRLRAHIRGCAECSTLERQARGRKSALRRIASSLGLPWFGKAAAVVLTVSATATTTGLIIERPAKPKPIPQVQQPAASRAVAQPPVAATKKQRVAPSPAHPARRARHVPQTAAASQSVRHKPTPDSARVGTGVGGPTAQAPTTAAAGPEPSAAPGAPPSATPGHVPVAVPQVVPAGVATPAPLPLPDPVATVLAPVTAVATGPVATLTTPVAALATPVAVLTAPVAKAAEPVAAPVAPVAAAVAPVTAVVAPVAAAVAPVTTAVAPVTTAAEPVTTAVPTVTNALPVTPPPAPALPGGLLGHK